MAKRVSATSRQNGKRRSLDARRVLRGVGNMEPVLLPQPRTVLELRRGNQHRAGKPSVGVPDDSLWPGLRQADWIEFPASKFQTGWET